MAIKETVEREVKLRAGETFQLPELGGEAIEPRLFVSTYHDTADHRLARRGITLRHRVENGKGLWQLKLPHGRSRLELEAEGGPAEPPAELLGAAHRPSSRRRRCCRSRACERVARGSGRTAPRSSTTRSPCSTTSG